MMQRVGHHRGYTGSSGPSRTRRANGLNVGGGDDKMEKRAMGSLEGLGVCIPQDTELSLIRHLSPTIILSSRRSSRLVFSVFPSQLSSTAHKLLRHGKIRRSHPSMFDSEILKIYL